jgi:hypothetical protein
VKQDASQFITSSMPSKVKVRNCRDDDTNRFGASMLSKLASMEEDRIQFHSYAPHGINTSMTTIMLEARFRIERVAK